MPEERGPSESGMLVYPQLPIPKRGETEIRRPSRPSHPSMGARPRYGVLAILVVIGAVIGFFVRPMLKADPKVAELENQLANQKKLTATQKARADEAARQSTELTNAATATTAHVAELEQAVAAAKAKEADAATIAKANEAVQAKLAPAIEKGAGSITSKGDEVHVTILDTALFKPGEDELSDKGKAMLAKLAAVLKQMPDKLIWVEGHTDNSPPPRPPPPKKPAKGAAPAPPPVRHATNWEFSSARATAVVRYFQEIARLEPTRMAALAFGPYQPVSRSSRSANRRIEIVLLPKPAKK
ncbi:MAG: flagellar motor protein MotB [Kofleriaceae bacterium]